MQLIDFEISGESIGSAIERHIASRLETADSEWRHAMGIQTSDIQGSAFKDEEDWAKVLPVMVSVGEISPLDARNAREHPFLKARGTPALIDLRNRSAVLHHGGNLNEAMAEVLQRYLLELVARLDPSVVQCTIIDQRDFGSAFAIAGSVLKNPRVITDRHGVEQLFRELIEELTKRNQVRGHSFQYIYDYNRVHGDSSVPYHFVLIASYEEDLNTETQATLARMLANDNAARAGIHFLILHQKRESIDAIKEKFPSLPTLVASRSGNGPVRLQVVDPEGLNTQEAAFARQLAVVPHSDKAGLDALVERVRRHMHTRRLESVSIALPTSDEWQTLAWKKNSADGLEVVIGKSAGQLVNFRLGAPEIVHNALVGGAVGTGKTNLLHAIIVQCLAHYSPDELRLSLLDYKSGTEFNVYEKVPHLYALSLGSRTKFGTDLLLHFKQELERRAVLFKAAGVASLAGYREKTGEVLPRHLVVIDEFQVLLGHRQLGPDAKAGLEDLIRRGRSFGFNFILSSQTLKDASLQGATKSNIGCRICLKLSDSDCMEFLSTENTVPSRFQEVGQAVLNNQEGRLAGNLEFRAAYYPEGRIAEFCERIAAHRKPGSHAPYLYKDDDGYSKVNLELPTEPDSMVIGIEEGIPPVLHRFHLDSTKGPVFGVGSGELKVQFEANLKDEILRLGCSTREVDGKTLSTLVQELDTTDGQLPDVHMLIVRLRQRDAVNSSIQNAVRRLVTSAPTKLLMLIETPSAFNDLYLDRNAAELLICLDQRSYAKFGYGSELAGQSASIALFYPGESNAAVVKIPQVN
jgi:hypothetical protein